MKIFTVLTFLILTTDVFSQQYADTSYHPTIQNPAYDEGKGSSILIDEGHYNFHRKNGRYKTFSNLLERDGYVVKASRGKFDKKRLKSGKILVIANALNEKNRTAWYVPIYSAFTKREIKQVRDWVFHGGSLFLIADHMPWPGAAKDLALQFGFEFSNGFVLDTISKGPAIFSLKEGTLNKSIVTLGRDSTETVEQVASFTGQGIKLPEDATPILIFNENYVNMLPDTAFVYDDKTRIINAKGYSQGAYKRYGKGRIVVFGEAAMFTAQIQEPEKTAMGMNNQNAPENYQLLLNIIHWLDGKLD
ncbi:MAG: hypothetical protein JKY52_01800 [Flavobacteriales bacterium]|nr:hypothetical protein [Flavobacteriales bacterium]